MITVNTRMLTVGICGVSVLFSQNGQPNYLVVLLEFFLHGGE